MRPVRVYNSFEGSTTNHKKLPTSRTPATTNKGVLKLWVTSTIFPNRIARKNDPIFPAKFMMPATVPALLFPISMHAEKEIIPFEGMNK